MPGSCSSGLRSRPSAAAGSRRVERVRGEQHEQQEADADQPHHAEHARDASRRAGARLNSATASVQPAEHQHPQQQRAFVRAPRRGDAVARAAAASSSWCATFCDREVVGARSATRGSANAIATNTNCACAAGRASAISAASRRVRAPTSGSVPCASASAARGSGRTGRARESFCAPSRVGRRASPCACRRASALPRLRAACSSRRAWRAPRRAEHAVGAERALRDHALALLEQVGQDAGVDDRDASARCRSRRSARRPRPLALDAARLDQAADAERAALRRFVRRDLGRREEEHEVLWNAFSTSAAATPSAATPAPIQREAACGAASSRRPPARRAAGAACALRARASTRSRRRSRARRRRTTPHT